MRDKSLPKAGLYALFAVIFTIAIALALGAVWMSITLRVPSAYWWFGVPAGIIMGYTARAWVCHDRRWAVVLAVLGTLLAAIYMNCLLVGLKLAAVLGLGLVYTLQQAGTDMLLALAWKSAGLHVTIATLVGMALAGCIAWWYRGTRKRNTLTHQAP